MKNKLNIDWKKALIFFLVSAGLIYLTKSFWMSLGIILLLFVVDGLLANWDYRRKTRKIFDELKKMNEEREDGNSVHH